jgi:hypothetical protein
VADGESPVEPAETMARRSAFIGQREEETSKENKKKSYYVPTEVAIL